MMVVGYVVLISAAILGAQAVDWYKEGPIYQIYPASFADSDGDGIGDINGIIQHADYLADIGIGAVWMSPIFASPMRDNGYDVSNYTDINPLFGNISDVEKLIATFHDKGIKVLLDFVPNHTSNDCIWFTDSVKRLNNKDDWYVWRDPKGFDGTGKPLPPNNWRSLFGDGVSSWTYVESRKQFYLHQFGDFQPDLNYENQDVLAAVKECVRFWLRKGLDGFRMDAVPYIGETHFESDEPTVCTPDDGSYNCLSHIYTENQPLTHSVLDAFDQVLREPEFTSKGVRGLFLEAYNPIKQLITYYQNVSIPFNFQYISYIDKNSNALDFQNYTMEFMNNLNGNWPNWVVGNHDNSRVGSRMGADLIDSMNIITQLLPGTSITYNGEEIGMTDGVVRPDQRRDMASNRDVERTPMQWNSSKNAGFSSSNKPYLPANPNFYSVNVVNEKNNSNSHLNVYKKAVKLHKELIDTSLVPLNFSVYGSWVFGFQRPGIVVVTNLNNEEVQLVLRDLRFEVPDVVKIELASSNTNLTEGHKISSAEKLVFFPKSTVVFSYGSRSSAGRLLSMMATVIMLFVGISLL